LIALAAKFHELANSTSAHDFGAVMESLADRLKGDQPVAQQQQQIQPKKKD
jgi:hypothetical protein